MRILIHNFLVETQTIKWSFIFFVGMLAVSCSKGGVSSSGDPTIRQCIDAYCKAYREIDIPALDKMTTVAFQYTPGGTETMIRKDWLRLQKWRRDDETRGKLAIKQYELRDMIIDFYDDAAVVTGVLDKSEYVNSVRETGSYRSTQLWVKDHNTWKLAAAHESRMR